MSIYLCLFSCFNIPSVSKCIIVTDLFSVESQRDATYWDSGKDGVTFVRTGSATDGKLKRRFSHVTTHEQSGEELAAAGMTRRTGVEFSGLVQKR